MKESHRLFFIFLLFIVGHPAFAADAPKNVRAIVSGIVDLTQQ